MPLKRCKYNFFYFSFFCYVFFSLTSFLISLLLQRRNFLGLCPKSGQSSAVRRLPEPMQISDRAQHSPYIHNSFHKSTDEVITKVRKGGAVYDLMRT
jgi:hypothetical protein